MRVAKVVNEPAKVPMKRKYSYFFFYYFQDSRKLHKAKSTSLIEHLVHVHTYAMIRLLFLVPCEFELSTKVKIR